MNSNVVDWIWGTTIGAIPNITHCISSSKAVTQTNTLSKIYVHTESPLNGTVHISNGTFFCYVGIKFILNISIWTPGCLSECIESTYSRLEVRGDFCIFR